MDPTVTAAAIGVGGTVVVGVAGFGASIWNTRRAIANDREKRIWDKRAAAYEAALAELTDRGVTRERVLRHLSDSTSEVLADYIAALQTRRSFTMEPQLLAYASRPVQAALVMVRQAEDDASMRVNQLVNSTVPPEQSQSFREVARGAIHTAMFCDRDLVDLIRNELQGTRRSDAS